MSETLSSRRRLSFMSLVQNQPVMDGIFGRKQQVISVQLFFDESEAPSLSELRNLGDLVGRRFERIRGIPWELDSASSIFKDVNDWQAALDIVIQDVPLEVDSKENARLFLENVKLQQISTMENGVEVPLWRVYRVGRKSIVLTIDHTVGDGLSLAAILAVVSTVSKTGRTLRLDEVSPLFSLLCRSSALQRFVFRWGFLWPPNLLRCARIIMTLVSASLEPTNPLLPHGIEKSVRFKHAQKIPAENYGTVYLCPLPVALFKSLARAEGNNVTINDVLASCIINTVNNYFKSVGYKGERPIHFVTPMADPKDPDKFLDEQEGMSLRFCPVTHELQLDSADSKTTYRSVLSKVHKSFQLIKASCIGPLMLKLLNLIGMFSTPHSFLEDTMKESIGKASFVWSNVPGPTMPIFIAEKKVSEIQCLVSHAMCMMQTVSYNGIVYTSIQVDVRSSIESHKLSDAFNLTMEHAIQELLSGHEQSSALETLKAAIGSHTTPGPYLAIKEGD